MSQLPCPPKDIVQAPKQVQYKVLPNHCAHPGCDKPAAHEHHTVGRWFTRSWEERDWALLDGVLVPVKVPLCHWCHDKVTRNIARVSWNGKFFVWVDTDGEVKLNDYWKEIPLGGVVGVPESPFLSDDTSERDDSLHAGQLERPLDTSEGESDSRPSGTPSDSPQPGEECPACKRRVPHPKKRTTPTSKVVSFRMPLDSHESYEEIIEAAARHLGVYEQPFWKFTVVTAGLVYALQGPRNALKKEAA